MDQEKDEIRSFGDGTESSIEEEEEEVNEDKNVLRFLDSMDTYLLLMHSLSSTLRQVIDRLILYLFLFVFVCFTDFYTYFYNLNPKISVTLYYGSSIEIQSITPFSDWGGMDGWMISYPKNWNVIVFHFLLLNMELGALCKPEKL